MAVTTDVVYETGVELVQSAHVPDAEGVVVVVVVELLQSAQVLAAGVVVVVVVVLLVHL
jgi:hypothetical protein